jgi:uncharacterized membrane protein
MMPRALALHRMAVLSLVALIVLSVAWELVLAPLRPGGSWLVLKVIPLLLPLRGVLRQDVYTMQWSSMLILLYLAEGAVRVMTDTQAISIGLGWAEVILSLIYFISVIAYLRPIKKAAKQQAAAAIKKASQVPSHQ